MNVSRIYQRLIPGEVGAGVCVIVAVGEDVSVAVGVGGGVVTIGVSTGATTIVW